MKQTLLIILLSFLCACAKTPSSVYTIGISLDQDDHWRQKLSEEISREANKHPNIRIIWSQANANHELQGKQIDSLAAVGADLIIISTDAPDKINQSVDKVFNGGIPVVVSTKTNNYTAFIGTDNSHVGYLLGQCAIEYAIEKGYSKSNPLYIIELEGILTEASVKNRHAGLLEVIESTPFVCLKSSVPCDWDKDCAYRVCDSLITLYPEVQVIIAHNDIMARAAYKAAKARYPEKKYHIIGVDAIADGGEGLASIISGEIDASVSNYSQGDLMLLTALHILKHQPYERDYCVPSEIVTHNSQSLLKRMVNEISDDKNNLHYLSTEVNEIWTEANQLRLIIILLVVSLSVIIVLFIIILRFAHLRLRKQMERVKNEQLKYQQQQINVISAELIKVKTQQSQSEKFIKDFKQIILDHIDDSTFNIDTLSSELGVSRAQLFRKVKTYTGLTPIELMQQLRMKKAQQLLQKTDLSIQQVAYSVGIQSPSYFTQQYKKMFGILPTKEQREVPPKS